MPIFSRIKPAVRLLFLMGMLVLESVTPVGADGPKLLITDLKYEVTLAEKIASVRDSLISQLEAKNFAVINVLNVQEGLQGRGIDAPPLQLIEFCNLTKAYTVTRHVPNFEMFAPCRLALIERDGKTTVMVQRPAHVLSLLASDTKLSKEGRASLKQFDQDVRAILESLASGGF